VQDAVVEAGRRAAVGLIGEIAGQMPFDQGGEGDGTAGFGGRRILVLQFTLDDPRGDQILAIEGADAADQVFQFAHVAGPLVGLQPLQGAGVDRLGRQALAKGAQEEGAGQIRNIVGAVAQRRQAHAGDVQAEEQVLAEQSLLDQGAQITVGGGDDAGVGPPAGARIDRRLRAVDHPQQPGLGVQRHVADLVQEQGAAIGLDQLAQVAVAAAEQFGLDPLARHGGQVDDGEAAVLARAEVVQGAGDQFLACAGFAQDQHGQIRAHQPRDGAIDLLHRRRTANQRQTLIAHRARLGLGGLGVGRPAQRPFGGRGHVVEIEGFGHIFEGADLGGVDGGEQRVLGAHDDHRQLGPLLADAGQHVENILVRHHHVGDHQVPLAFRNPFQQGGGVAGGADLIAQPAERLTEHQPDGGVIVGNEDLVMG